ncbi:MAG: PssD/Cps14F family polysaccharide biosynthesis glycosyltransferase [Turicibacter sp.]
MKKGKIMFCSSAGGHYTELLQLRELIVKYNGIIVTEKTKVSQSSIYPTEYVIYSSKNDGWVYIFEYLYVWLVSFYYFIKYRPKVIISTGVHSTIPMCVYGRVFGRKVIYIETIANIHTPSMTGKIMYKIASEFYVQWEELLEVYPKAKFGGCLF